MKYFIKSTRMTLMIIFALFFILSMPLSAQIYPGTFGTTSVSNYGILSPIDLFGGTFGPTSLPNFGAYPYFPSYSMYSPYLGGSFLGGLYGLGVSPFLGGYGTDSGISNIFKAIQYYQYLSYAYQFYNIARSTPMFYMNDLVADYIGSSLYSYADKYSLSPQNAIISFIQQNLL